MERENAEGQFNAIWNRIERFRRRISPQVFNRGVLALAAIWFLGAYPLLNLFLPSWLPGSLRPTHCDFGQYYAGARAAKDGLWDALYPIPKPESNLPMFKPRYRTLLFNEEKFLRSRLNRPSIANPEASDFSPKLLEQCPELRENFSYRYMYPPPLALLLRPLAWTSYENARQHVWPILAMASLFGVAVCSARMHRQLHGSVSYIQGLIMAAVVVYSFRGRTAVADGNVSPILGFLIAFGAYAWGRQWQAAAGLAMIPLLLFKSISLNWCPLLLLGKARWKTIATLAVLTLALNVLALWEAGTGVYHQYFSEVLPRLTKPVGCGMVAVCFRSFGIFPSVFYAGIQLFLCACLYFGYWKNLRGGNAGNWNAVAAAALAGTIAVFCTLNFSVWDHYFPNYLFFPFLGWMAWEAAQARGKWRGVIMAVILVGVAHSAFNWAIQGSIFYLIGPEALDFYNDVISAPFYILLGPAFFLGVAFRRLYFLHDAVKNAGQEIAPLVRQRRF